MIHRSTRELVMDLERHGHLLRIPPPVDPDLEMAEIHRRVNRAGGPAILFERVIGSPFPAVSNIFGTMGRARFVFRHSLERIKDLIRVNAEPALILRQPAILPKILPTAWRMWPGKALTAPVTARQTEIEKLPQIRCWPEDGGPFVLLPQVYTENPEKPGIMHSNLGMYRIQMGGNEYRQNREVGLHYQLRRDIGIHHANALERGRPLRVSIFVGGPPAHSLAAIMPLPEGMPEVTFAGGLAGRRFQFVRKNGHLIAAEADFCITGTVMPGETKPEGPFGDHLGYYSLEHPFPYLHVDAVYHRKDAVWPFTVVGRPPQEDSIFSRLVHEITAPMVPASIPGLVALHAVDAAGVHPLMLAIGRERELAYQDRKPRELLKTANALLGFGHCALAKYLMITAFEDAPGLDINDIPGFFRHLLERVDWRTDLHFQTETTMDTLDYTGTALNEGGKVIIAAAGPPKRRLADRLPNECPLPEGFSKPLRVIPGIIAMKAPPFENYDTTSTLIGKLAEGLSSIGRENGLMMLVLVDDPDFAAGTFENWLWVTFTRSNPSHDIYGVNSFVQFKHWGCEGPLIIDARLKPHHAPPLVEAPEIKARVDKMGEPGGCLHGII